MKDISSKLPSIEASIKEIINGLNQKADKKQVESMQKQLEDLKNELLKLKELLQKLMKESNENKEGLASLKSRFESLESKFSYLSKTVTELQAKIEKGGHSEKGKDQNLLAQDAKSHIDDEEWNEIKRSVEKLKKDVSDILRELESLRDLKSRLSAFESMLDLKLDKEEFEKWKQGSNIEQILSGLVKKFADRNEMLKALKKLENRLLMLEEMITKEGIVDTGENAMLTKKPLGLSFTLIFLGGYSCASCQKDLINIEGFRVPYYPWNKLPQRNPAERIAKVYYRNKNRLDKDFQECSQC